MVVVIVIVIVIVSEPRHNTEERRSSKVNFSLSVYFLLPCHRIVVCRKKVGLHVGIAKKECLPSTANITQIVNGLGVLIREYISNYTKLQERSLRPLLRVP